jgi:hypothetical protein
MKNESKSEKPVPSSGLENEGEGNKTAARHYNEATQKYVESGKVDDAAREAQEALEGPEGEALRRAEKEGKSHAAGAKPSK